MKILLACVTISCLFYSCTCPCVKADLQFGLIGFSDAETDTIILKKFEKNSNFMSLRDSFLFGPDDIRFSRRSDTLQPVAYLSHAILEPAFDYEFYLPQSQTLFRISETRENQLDQNCGTNKVACINQITSCKLNNMPGFPIADNRIYLRK